MKINKTELKDLLPKWWSIVFWICIGLVFFGCELTPESELTETSNQLSRTLPTQISVVGEVFTYTW
jgi:hypothetical protein